ncbi:hypothetical protein A3D07_02050 [Candidatus Curtissbacteria bacterium RIFCSPHIGHO2_02_FULL_42_15]|uniref:HicB family protein n=1 Tax=Candidatus Curtissbacteria bacterium RIFCSPHIGHO2_02_FULL_42_15 TaxID=1797716 RepID=A0A1F5GH39_9BACT|nr:MAG: hypothetical protein A3D07_02050 [Candidatus Curtissbacteria bacterium RIFCSPHIGHO2_02_FULL_42_15]
MKNFHYVIWKEGRWFVARSLEVEVASQGKTRKEAVENLHEALELYFEDEKKPAIAKIEQPRLHSFSLALNA